MGRSKSKLVYIHRSQFKKYLFNNKKRIIRTPNYYELLLNKKATIKPFFLLWKRGAPTVNHYVDNKIGIYNGKYFLVNNVKDATKGFKLGELANARKKPNHKASKKPSVVKNKTSKNSLINKYTTINYIKSKKNKKKKK